MSVYWYHTVLLFLQSKIFVKLNTSTSKSQNNLFLGKKENIHVSSLDCWWNAYMCYFQTM